MNADSPDLGLPYRQLPKLLQNPQDVVAHEEAVGETIGQNFETLAGQGTESAAIESVSRLSGSDEQART